MVQKLEILCQTNVSYFCINTYCQFNDIGRVYLIKICINCHFFLDKVTCASNGDFLSDNVPTCAVPKTCVNASNPTNKSGLANPSQTSVKAYRSIEYTCKVPSNVMDTHGKKYKLDCLGSGNFATPTWDATPCREAANCTGDIPIPPKTSGLDNSTSSLATMKEWDEAIYKCKDSSHVVGKIKIIKMTNN